MTDSNVNYLRLINVLKQGGFEVKTFPGPVVLFKGCSVEGGFAPADAHKGMHPALVGQVCADHVDCFDKWRKCPVALLLPSNEQEMAALLRMLAHLGTDEGREISNTYAYLDDNPYTYGNIKWCVRE